jgi:type IV secretory pathway VirJ component
VFSLSPDENADFEVHIVDMLSMGSLKDTFDVVGEMKKIKSSHPVCIFGEGENEEICNRFAETGATIITLPGKHHYNNNATVVAETILDSIYKERSE